MHSLLKSRKAQFFVLSAFIIVSILLLISRWIEPLTIIDTSAIVLSQEPFIFNNIKEKANETVAISRSCEELKLNLEEYKKFVQEFTFEKNIKLNFKYDVVDTALEPCADDTLKTRFDMSLESPTTFIYANFTSSKK